MLFPRLMVLAFVAMMSVLNSGCVSMMERRESEDGLKREASESSQCIGMFCGTASRGATIYVAPSRHGGAGRGYGYVNPLDGSQRGACYGVVYGPGPNDRRVRYEPTLERDQFGRPTVWTCAPGRRNSPPGPDGCCAD